MTETFRYVMRGERRSPTGPTRYAQVQLGPGSDQVEERIEPLLAEFPKVSPRVVGARHRYVYAIGGDYSMRGGLAALLRRDVETGEVQQFEFGPDTVPEEHVFVPRPDGGKEDDGWLLGTVLDTEERITRLNVFVRRRPRERTGRGGEAALPTAARIPRPIRERSIGNS